MKLTILFLDHVWNDKLTGKLFHQCALHIDEVLWPFIHLKRDQEKHYKIHFVNEIHHNKTHYNRVCE
jgi:hypothetical protein